MERIDDIPLKGVVINNELHVFEKMLLRQEVEEVAYLDGDHSYRFIDWVVMINNQSIDKKFNDMIHNRTELSLKMITLNDEVLTGKGKVSCLETSSIHPFFVKIQGNGEIENGEIDEKLEKVTSIQKVKMLLYKCNSAACKGELYATTEQPLSCPYCDSGAAAAEPIREIEVNC